MEEDLDQISRGEREWLDFIKQFYRGDKHHRGLEEAVKQAQETAEYPLIDVGVDPASGEKVRVRIGRYGPFIQLGEGGPGKTAGLPPTQAPADLSVEKAMTLVRAKAAGPRTLGVDPKSGMNVYAINGRFGAYVQLGEMPEKGSKEKPKRSSMVGSMTESTVTLEEALQLLALPRDLGADPTSGEVIVAGLGRFGPYIKKGDDYRSLDETDDLFTVGLERALALLAAPKRSARQAAKRVIRKIEVPNGGNALQVLEGRFGPYVTDGETNASIPRGVDPATISLEEAQGLLEARRGAPPREKRRGRRGPAGAAPRGRGRRAAKTPDVVAVPPAAATKVKAKGKTKPKPKAAAGKRAARKRAS
jgi:DNA topoisomerase-1